MNLSKKLSIENLETLKSKRILMRVDYNVPLDKDNKVDDNRRIVSTIPTIKLALEKGTQSIVLISHLGRPNGQKKESLSLKHIIPELQKALKPVTDSKVVFIPSFESHEYKTAVSSPNKGSIFLLENLRFNIEEEGKGLDSTGEKVTASPEAIKDFRKKLSILGDIFIFDAFAASHRPHSSVVGIDIEQKAAGLLMQKELNYFNKVLQNPQRPFLSILGGAKVSDKILLIESLLDKVDEMIVAGGMAYTFLKVLKGTEIGKSLFDEAGSKIVKNVMQKAEKKGVKIHLPVDFLTSDKFSPDANTKLVDASDGIPKEWMGLDCGPKSAKLFSEIASRAKTIVWNGPLGVFEFEKFSHGTEHVLKSVANAEKATTIIGGGDTASAAEKFGLSEKMSHVSTGGGASLELLEGKVLPGVENLSDIQ